MFVAVALTCAMLAHSTCGASNAVIQIAGVPHIRQLPDFCGEACVAMALQKSGHAHTQSDVFNASGLDPKLARGCYARDLAKAMTVIGLDPGEGWYSATAGHLAGTISAQWNQIVADLRLGVPTIVCMHSHDGPDATEHFRLVTGYDADQREVIFHEPSEDDGAYRRMPLQLFQKLWPLKTGTKKDGVIRFACRPRRIEKPAAKQGFSPADYAQHFMQLKKEVPGVMDKFELTVEKPFVVLGDLNAEELNRFSEKTVRWAVAMLKKDYFAKEPDEIIDIWLFKNAASYTNNAVLLTAREPTTPFGFYDDEHHALIMNIRTGGGTLVHEIVHPFMHANFPACPSWFNEGLASLYEQSSERDGHIVGLTNWRLRGLQDAIAEKRLPSFEKLCGTSDADFYHEDRGTNYAQARYLCYYLQERGLLVKYYHAFVKNAEDDPTGYKTLCTVLGEKDMAAFQKKFESYVTRLRFP